MGKQSYVMENQKGFKISQYACAVLLIVSSIAMVAECKFILYP